MVRISGTTLYLTRGDTLSTTLVLRYADGTPYEPVEGDTIRFACKENYDDEECLIEKNIPIDTMNLVIEPSDTAGLEQPMTLVYDIELSTIGGYVMTVINKGKLNITEEVH